MERPISSEKIGNKTATIIIQKKYSDGNIDSQQPSTKILYRLSSPAGN
jgi:hypothetical protein